MGGFQKVGALNISQHTSIPTKSILQTSTIPKHRLLEIAKMFTDPSNGFLGPQLTSPLPVLCHVVLVRGESKQRDWKQRIGQ